MLKTPKDDFQDIIQKTLHQLEYNGLLEDDDDLLMAQKIMEHREFMSASQFRYEGQDAMRFGLAVEAYNTRLNIYRKKLMQAGMAVVLLNRFIEFDKVRLPNIMDTVNKTIDQQLSNGAEGISPDEARFFVMVWYAKYFGGCSPVPYTNQNKYKRLQIDEKPILKNINLNLN